MTIQQFVVLLEMCNDPNWITPPISRSVMCALQCHMCDLQCHMRPYLFSFSHKLCTSVLANASNNATSMTCCLHPFQNSHILQAAVIIMDSD